MGGMRWGSEGGEGVHVGYPLRVKSLVSHMALGYPYDLLVPLELAEGLRAERVGDLGVDPGVLDVLVAQVVGETDLPPSGYGVLLRRPRRSILRNTAGVTIRRPS